MTELDPELVYKSLNKEYPIMAELDSEFVKSYTKEPIMTELDLDIVSGFT